MKNKYFIVLLIIFLSLSNYFIYGQGYREELNSIQIHIEEGSSQVIRVLKEGILCRAFVIDSTGALKNHINFFPMESLDYKKVYELKKFIYDNSFFSNDTICDQAGIGTTALPIYTMIIKDDKLNLIIWKDGKCKELEKCIEMINDLIPEEKRDTFKIYYKQLIPED